MPAGHFMQQPPDQRQRTLLPALLMKKLQPQIRSLHRVLYVCFAEVVAYIRWGKRWAHPLAAGIYLSQDRCCLSSWSETHLSCPPLTLLHAFNPNLHTQIKVTQVQADGQWLRSGKRHIQCKTQVLLNSEPTETAESG